MKKIFGENYWLAMYFFNTAHKKDFGQKLEDEKLFRENTSARFISFPT